ncbi:hypothetical protein V6N13_008313 [Hibiscus sabdariffa]
MNESFCCKRSDTEESPSDPGFEEPGHSYILPSCRFLNLFIFLSSYAYNESDVTSIQMPFLANRAPNRTHSFLHFNLRLPFYLSFSSRHSNLKRSRGIQINARCYDDFSRLGALRVQWNQVPYSGCKAEEEGEWAQPHQQLAFSTRKELKMKQESVFTIYEVECFE